MERSSGGDRKRSVTAVVVANHSYSFKQPRASNPCDFATSKTVHAGSNPASPGQRKRPWGRGLWSIFIFNGPRGRGPDLNSALVLKSFSYGHQSSFFATVYPPISQENTNLLLLDFPFNSYRIGHASDRHLHGDRAARGQRGSGKCDDRLPTFGIREPRKDDRVPELYVHAG